MIAADDDRMGDVNDVARLLGVPRSWVYTNAEAGVLPSYKFGHYRRFSLQEIKAWAAQQRQNGSGTLAREAAR